MNGGCDDTLLLVPRVSAKYAALEVLRNPWEAGPKADLWSLGASIWECCVDDSLPATEMRDMVDMNLEGASRGGGGRGGVESWSLCGGGARGQQPGSAPVMTTTGCVCGGTEMTALVGQLRARLDASTQGDAFLLKLFDLTLVM